MWKQNPARLLLQLSRSFARVKTEDPSIIVRPNRAKIPHELDAELAHKATSSQSVLHKQVSAHHSGSREDASGISRAHDERLKSLSQVQESGPDTLHSENSKDRRKSFSSRKEYDRQKTVSHTEPLLKHRQIRFRQRSKEERAPKDIDWVKEKMDKVVKVKVPLQTTTAEVEESRVGSSDFRVPENVENAEHIVEFKHSPHKLPSENHYKSSSNDGQRKAKNFPKTRHHR